MIAERKLQFAWGAWLKGGSQDGSEASEQTGACKGGCSSGCHTHAHGTDNAGEEGSSGGAQEDEEEQEDKQTTKDQVGRHVQYRSHMCDLLLYPVVRLPFLTPPKAAGGYS